MHGIISDFGMFLCVCDVCAPLRFHVIISGVGSPAEPDILWRLEECHSHSREGHASRARDQDHVTKLPAVLLKRVRLDARSYRVADCG